MSRVWSVCKQTYIAIPLHKYRPIAIQCKDDIRFLVIRGMSRDIYICVQVDVNSLSETIRYTLCAFCVCVSGKPVRLSGDDLCIGGVVRNV